MNFYTINKSLRFKLTLLFGFLASAAAGQTLISLDGSLNFPATDELVSTTQSLRLFNPNAYPITVTGVERFDVYGDKVFSVSDSQFTVLSLDTIVLQVSFLPKHNIQHKQVLVFKSNSGFGHTEVPLIGQGTYSQAYYSSTQNKDQEQLKTALSARMAQGYNSLSYSVARDNMYATIDNVGGVVTCVYTGRTATFNTRAGANANTFNCEHTFPQGFFNSNIPMRSDIHHLFPTDVTSNSRRGNDPFGLVTTASWSQGGSKSGGGKFEPRDVHKGAVARAMMYFVLRYQDYSNHFSSQEVILRQWHDLYPPTAADRSRNSAIFGVQNNRNPFVDYPQFIERISDINGTASNSDDFTLYFSDDTIQLAQGTSALTRDFSFVIYNSGNKTMAVSNFTLSDPDLSFKNGNPGNVSLDAGDSYAVEILFTINKNYQATLNFDQTGLAASNSIPVVSSGPQLSSPAFAETRLPQFFPNPNQGRLFINEHGKLKSLFIINTAGVRAQLEVMEELELGSLNPGLYILEYQMKQGAGIYHSKLRVL